VKATACSVPHSSRPDAAGNMHALKFCSIAQRIPLDTSAQSVHVWMHVLGLLVVLFCVYACVRVCVCVCVSACCLYSKCRAQHKSGSGVGLPARIRSAAFPRKVPSHRLGQVRRKSSTLFFFPGTHTGRHTQLCVAPALNAKPYDFIPLQHESKSR
jgi:hypothetical protein